MRTLGMKSLVAVVTTLVLSGFGTTVSGSLIDLGIRAEPFQIIGPAQGAAFIEQDQGLSSGTLIYFNRFLTGPSGGFVNDGAVDDTHFTASASSGAKFGNITWDVTNTGFELSYVFLKDGQDANGLFLYHLYGVTPDQVFKSNGNQIVTIDGVKRISYITFFGVPFSPVPESGATLLLLGISCGALGALRNKYRPS